MNRFLSPDHVEQLLADTSVPGELDASASRVEYLLAAMHSPAQPAGAETERHAVSAIVDAVRQSPRPLAAHRRTRVRTKVRSARLAVVGATLAALLAGGTAAAAATGTLPGPAQSAVSSALGHVGISVPGPNAHANAHATNNPHRATGHQGGATGHDATANANYGLCKKWATTPAPNPHSHKNDTGAFANLQQAAAAAGMSVADYCKGFTPSTGNGGTTTMPPKSPEQTSTTGSHVPPVSTPSSSGNHSGQARSGNATAHPTGRP
jgi:hypothetical protein